MKRIFAIFCVLVCLFVLAAPAMAASDTITITVQVPKEWTSVHLYAWIDDTHNLVAWPGTPMTKCSDGRYKLEIPAGYPYVIINNGLGSGQTLDLFIGGTSDMWIVMETCNLTMCVV